MKLKLQIACHCPVSILVLKKPNEYGTSADYKALYLSKSISIKIPLDEKFKIKQCPEV